MSESSSASLEAIGLTDERRAEAAEFGDVVVGRVIRIDRAVASVSTETGESRVAIPLEADLAVGDFVTLDATGALGQRVRSELKPGVTVLVKGSRVNRLERVVQVLTAPGPVA